jgi:hypothetical protein
MNMIIIEAIMKKLFIRFEYDFGVRIVEPYRYGRSVKGDKDLLRAYQLKNSNKTLGVEGWRLFDSSIMKRIEVLPECFEKIRIGCNFEDDALMKTYYAELKR